MLTHRAWYAAQRAGLHLDAVKSGRREKRAYIAEHIGVIGASLGLGPDAIASMLAGARLLPYAEGEIVQPVNSIPAGVGFITAGAVGMVVTTEDGRTLSLGELTAGDYIGGTSLTRQRMITGVIALTDATLVSVSRDAMNKVVQQDHRLARQIGEVIELRRRSAREALSEAAQGLR